jgi:transposase
VQDIRQLHQQGLCISEIAVMTGHDRKTIRKYLKKPWREPKAARRRRRRSKLDAHKAYIEERLREGVWNAAVLLRELCERGYTGRYTILKDYLAPKRRAAREAAVRRFETPPGQQGQVDWGSAGVRELPDGGQERLSAFVFTLGHSRAMFADVTTDEQLPTLLRLHEAAFAELGGVPQEILYDNMRTVILGYHERGEPRWHPVFRDFARYWGFTPRACKPCTGPRFRQGPYRAQTKGKVESGIKYIKRNFLCGREASSLEDLRGQLRSWTSEVANARVHGTTHRVVRDAWKQERQHLQPLSGRRPYPYVPEVSRRVPRDAYISYGSNRYSVPWQYVGREVQVRERDGQIHICHGGRVLARHGMLQGRHQVCTVPAHHARMPYAGSGRSPSSPQLRIGVAAPDVQTRPLAIYDTMAGGG